MGGIIADVGFSDLGLKRGWDAQERDEMVRAHREIRCERGVVMTEHVDSIQALMDQGYNLTDIGVMFGVTRERVRQIVNEHGLERADERQTMYRIWDDRSERFIPISRDDMAEQVRLWAIESENAWGSARAYHREQRTLRRINQIEAIRALAADLGRPPFAKELTQALGYGNPQQISICWGFSHDEDCDPYRDAACDHVTALDRAWAAAGFDPRPDGRAVSEAYPYSGGQRR